MRKWDASRYPWRRSCEQCRADPDKQVLEGHDDCLPPVNGRHTADESRVPVTVGLRVWDYDLRPGVVISVNTHYDGTPDGPLGIVAWHNVEHDDGSVGLFDGTRMWTLHPVTGKRPPERVTALH